MRAKFPGGEPQRQMNLVSGAKDELRGGGFDYECGAAAREEILCGGNADDFNFCSGAAGNGFSEADALVFMAGATLGNDANQFQGMAHFEE